MTRFRLLRVSCWGVMTGLSVAAAGFVISQVPGAVAATGGVGGEALWTCILVAAILAGALAGAVTVKLALVPAAQVSSAGDERARIMLAASGTGKAAAAMAAGLVTAGFKGDAAFPPAAVLGVIVGIVVLLLAAAESSYSVRQL